MADKKTPKKSPENRQKSALNRVIKSTSSKKTTACPKCKSFPTVTRIRRDNYELRRCRVCEHVFEIKSGGN